MIRKVKNLNIYVSLLFNKLEPASSSRGAPGYRPPHYAPAGSALVFGLSLKEVIEKILLDVCMRACSCWFAVTPYQAVLPPPLPLVLILNK